MSARTPNLPTKLDLVKRLERQSILGRRLSDAYSVHLVNLKGFDKRRNVTIPTTPFHLSLYDALRPSSLGVQGQWVASGRWSNCKEKGSAFNCYNNLLYLHRSAPLCIYKSSTIGLYALLAMTRGSWRRQRPQRRKLYILEYGPTAGHIMRKEATPCRRQRGSLQRYGRAFWMLLQ